MPSKDSFTFSDKLKKSKSLPLSKRIPSRSGGDGKAKRTLIQRAQRDLPFIIVAASALMLLPLLGRNSGADYPSGLDNPGYDNFVGDGGNGFDYVPGDGDIVPSNKRNPLDLIVRPDVVDKDHTDTPPVNDDYNTDNMINRRNSYEDSGSDNKRNNISTFSKSAKKGVRNAVNREATKLGALRNRNASFGNGNGGLTRNLAIGGAPVRNAAPNAPRAGVRPVALQPMESGGSGRVLTGDNLFSERDRAVGALNQGSAKQALFEAQLRDVDGSPLGAAGDPRAAAARLASQGAVPDHKFNYTNQKPWWWDMMQDRSQKMWELWNYNWQKALSDSLIKVATNLSMCLLTGSEDGSVKYFLGKRGGDKDVCCLIDGEEICAGDIGDYTSSTSGSGDSKETTNNSFAAIQSFCKDQGAKPYVSETGRKNAIQMRARCLGAEGDWWKNLWKGAKYEANCDGVNGKDLVYTATVKRRSDGKTRKVRQDKLVIYVLATDKNSDDKTPFVIKLNESRVNKLVMKEDEIIALSTNCELTNVGSFRGRETRRHIDFLHNDIRDEDILFKKHRGNVDAAYNYCKGATSKPDFTHVDRALLFKEFNVKYKGFNNRNYDEETVVAKNKERNKTYKEYAISSGECQIKNFNAKFEALDIDQTGKKISCFNKIQPNLTAAPTQFSAQISGLTPKDNVHAIWIENGEKDGTSGVWVRSHINFSLNTNKNFVKGDVFTMPGRQMGEHNANDQKAKPDSGRVIWVVTGALLKSALAKDEDTADKFIAGKWAHNLSLSDVAGVNGAYTAEICDYNWGCSAESCPVADRDDEDDQRRSPDITTAPLEGDYCAVEEGGSYSFYEAIRVPKGDATVYVQKNTTPIEESQKEAFLAKFGIDSCNSCISHQIGSETDGQDKIHLCQPICKKRIQEGEFRGDILDIVRRNVTGEGEPEPDGEPLIKANAFDDLPGLREVIEEDALCPYCNPTNEEIAKACNFAAFLSFDTTSFSPQKDKVFDALLQKNLMACLETVSDNTEAGQDIYVTGFTSFAGSDSFEKCPTYDNGVTNKNAKLNSWGGVDVVIKEGVVQKANYGKEGKNDKEARKKCNRALSEDRAIYSMHQIIGQLAQTPSLTGDLDSKITLSLTPKTTNVVGFRNTTPKDELDKDGYMRYDKRENPMQFGNGRIKVNVIARGCGPEGAKPGDVADDRVIYFSTKDHQCNREQYIDDVEATGDIAVRGYPLEGE